MKILIIILILLKPITLLSEEVHFNHLPTLPQQSQYYHLPYNKDKSYNIIQAKIYAYNSIPNQTDSTPFITASGYNLGNKKQHYIVANNCLPFGSLISINGIFYTVNDRMNKRYGCKVFDIWMPEKQNAINWGVKYMDVKVYNR